MQIAFNRYIMKGSNKIGEIGNYYGGLHIKAENGKYYCAIEDYEETEWEEITKTLYYGLISFEAHRVKSDDELDSNVNMRVLCIIDVALSNRIITSFIEHKPEINTIDDLLNYSEKDLLKRRNFGNKSLFELKEYLNKHNLKLKL